MGGYGGANGRIKEKCYRNTGGFKVTDKNAIEVAEQYINEGKYVAFLQEKPNQKRADLSVEGHHVEVKGLSTMKVSTVETKIKTAFEQIHGDDFKYSADTYRTGKLIILSKHDKSISKNKIIDVIKKGFSVAQRKGNVTGKVELWINGEIYKLN